MSDPSNKTYLVCATHRSGSNLLCQALWHTDLAGRPQEFFSPTHAAKISETHELGVDPNADYVGYLNALMAKRATSNGVFGGKIMWPHLETFHEQIGGSLADVFPNLSYIWVRRDDKLLQAISHWKAKQTKVYNSLQENSVPAEELKFDYEEIRKIVKRFTEQDEAWGAFFEQNGIEPFEVHYEAFANDYEATTRKMVEFLGVNIPDEFRVKPLTYKKLADEINEAWQKQYLEIESQRG
jgi:LPS sulfotransferase NodH